MMIKANELAEAALDWSVGKAKGDLLPPVDQYLDTWLSQHRYSSDWALSGPIIEHRRIELQYLGYDNPQWGASRFNPSAFQRWKTVGPTPLVAAMRCYVASVLGDEVDVPNELMEI